MDDQQVEHEQPHQQNRVLGVGFPFGDKTADELLRVRGRLRRRNRSEADLLAAVVEAVDHQVVGGFEGTGCLGGLGTAVEQPVQVKHEAHVDGPPVGLPDVVEGVPVARQLLLAAGPQPRCSPGDDPFGALCIGDNDALECGGCRDRLNPGPKRQLLKDARQLSREQPLGALALVDACQGARHRPWDGGEERYAVLEAAHANPARSSSQTC